MILTVVFYHFRTIYCNGWTLVFLSQKKELEHLPSRCRKRTLSIWSKQSKDVLNLIFILGLLFSMDRHRKILVILVLNNDIFTFTLNIFLCRVTDKEMPGYGEPPTSLWRRYAEFELLRNYLEVSNDHLFCVKKIILFML